jgi:protein-tyrosine phosphatase
MKSLSIRFGLFNLAVFGGPYRQRPKGTFGVKMAREIDLPYDVSVPTVDFQVPPVEAMERGLITTLYAIARREKVYVGCMGGIGRTGTFLALLARATGVQPEVAVQYVRRYYNEHAVETREQRRYVERFDLTRVRKHYRIARIVALAYFWKRV